MMGPTVVRLRRKIAAHPCGYPVVQPCITPVRFIRAFHPYVTPIGFICALHPCVTPPPSSVRFTLALHPPLIRELHLHHPFVAKN